MNRKIFKLHDSAIMGMVRVLQQAMLTKTDVTDHFRMMRFEPMRDDAHTLELTNEYLTADEENLNRLVEEAEEIKARLRGNSGPFAVEEEPRSAASHDLLESDSVDVVGSFRPAGFTPKKN